MSCLLLTSRGPPLLIIQHFLHHFLNAFHTERMQSFASFLDPYSCFPPISLLFCATATDQEG